MNKASWSKPKEPSRWSVREWGVPTISQTFTTRLKAVVSSVRKVRSPHDCFIAEIHIELIATTSIFEPQQTLACYPMVWTPSWSTRNWYLLQFQFISEISSQTMKDSNAISLQNLPLHCHSPFQIRETKPRVITSTPWHTVCNASWCECIPIKSGFIKSKYCRSPLKIKKED